MGFVMFSPPGQACHRNNIKFCCSFLPRLFMYLAGQDQQVYVSLVCWLRRRLCPNHEGIALPLTGEAQALSR